MSSHPNLTPGSERAAKVIARCREIAAFTETPGQITRTFLSPPMHAVHQRLRSWMEAAGMQTSVDAIGNLRGIFPASSPSARRLILGSHLDTVPNAGAFDGVLGVVLALAAVESLPAPLHIAVEIVAFSEEEGVRFRKPFLGSLALTGELDAAALLLTDAEGHSIEDAIRHFGLDPAQLPAATLGADAAAYLEVHIEQGPVLESLMEAAAWTPTSGSQRPGEPSTLGVVEAISGQSRLLFTFRGQANHAGATPMLLRHDALAAAAEWMVAVEAHARVIPGLVATVGQVHVEPGAANVIPGFVRLSLDVRHGTDAVRQRAIAGLLARAAAAAAARGVSLEHQEILEQPAVPMHGSLVRLLRTAVTRAGHTPHLMPSGAGHDAMILAPHLPSAMLFVRSPGGLSHHPDETVLASDVEAALETLLEFLRLVSHDEVFTHA